MAKNTFLDFSTTAGDNTDIAGIGILGTNAVSNFDNAFRTIMAILRRDIDNGVVLTSKSGAYTAVANDNNAALRFTAAATLSLTAAATLGADWHCVVMAVGGDVTIDPNGAETINGNATLALKQGESAIVYCDGTAFFADVNSLPPVTIYPSYVAKSANYTALDADYQVAIRFTAAATLAFDTTANLRTNWRIEVWNDSTGNVTIDPASTDTINGTATHILQPGQKAEIFKTGATTFQASVFGDQLSGPQIQGYSYGLTLTQNASDTANDIDFGAGAAVSDTSPFYLMQFPAMTKQIDAAWASGTNAGMLDTGTVGNNVYYIFGIQRSDTLARDFLASLSSTAPTMPANYDRKRLLGIVLRVSGVNSIAGYAETPRAVISSRDIALSGAAVLVSAVPAGARRIRIVGRVAFSALAELRVQLGTSAGVVTTGYNGARSRLDATNAGSNAWTGNGADVMNGGRLSAAPQITLERIGNGNEWSISSTAGLPAQNSMDFSGGYVLLPGGLDRIQITTTIGTATMSGNLSMTVEF